MSVEDDRDFAEPDNEYQDPRSSADQLGASSNVGYLQMCIRHVLTEPIGSCAVPVISRRYEYGSGSGMLSTST